MTAMPGPGVPFKPGQSGNLKGRPRGSRHRLSERVLADLTADFEDHGAAAIRRTREKDPAAYVRLIASLLPKQTEKVANQLEDLTDDQLEQLDRLLAATCQEEPPE
jgi:hypothetical protein